MVTGGIRRRLIRESLYQMVWAALDDLNWFDSGRDHQVITFNFEPVEPDDVIAYNTMAIGDGDETDTDWELGSLMAEHIWTFYIDFFAENATLGLEVMGDVKDILEGRIESIGRDDPSFIVYDYRMTTPAELFVCQIENVMRDRAVNATKPHQKYWYAIRFDVLDYYGSESG